MQLRGNIANDLLFSCAGADISDYFNYGFTEETWKAYSEKQRLLRIETGALIGTQTRIVSPDFVVFSGDHKLLPMLSEMIYKHFESVIHLLYK